MLITTCLVHSVKLLSWNLYILVIAIHTYTTPSYILHSHIKHSQYYTLYITTWVYNNILKLINYHHKFSFVIFCAQSATSDDE